MLTTHRKSTCYRVNRLIRLGRGTRERRNFFLPQYEMKRVTALRQLPADAKT
jgi:hypothetical protein